MADHSFGPAAVRDGGRHDAESAVPAVSTTVRFFAAARAAAATQEEEFSLPAGCTVAQVLAAAVRAHGAELARVLQRCSFLLDSVAVRDTGIAVTDGQVLDVLPPFAGG